MLDKRIFLCNERFIAKRIIGLSFLFLNRYLPKKIKEE